MSNDLGEYAVRAGPALGVSGLHLFGLPIADVVSLLVAIYTVLQIASFALVRYNKWKDTKNGR
jgi:hypothetical protein